jgi:hypothetical protein
MRKTKTEKFVDEAKSIADQAVKWLSDRVEDAPDMDEIKDVVGDKTKETVETLKDRMEDMASWLGDVADNMKSSVVPEPENSKGKKTATVVGVGAAVAGGLYFFNPTYGKRRRARLKEYFVQLKDRFLGGNSGDTDFHSDGSGNLHTVDSDKIAGISGSGPGTI